MFTPLMNVWECQCLGLLYECLHQVFTLFCFRCAFFCLRYPFSLRCAFLFALSFYFVGALVSSLGFLSLSQLH